MHQVESYQVQRWDGVATSATTANNVSNFYASSRTDHIFPQARNLQIKSWNCRISRYFEVVDFVKHSCVDFIRRSYQIYKIVFHLLWFAAASIARSFYVYRWGSISIARRKPHHFASSVMGTALHKFSKQSVAQLYTCIISQLIRRLSDALLNSLRSESYSAANKKE